MKQIFSLFALFLSVVSVGFSQPKAYTSMDSIEFKYHNWYNFDFENDSILGVSVDRTYTEIIKDKTPVQKVVVAVIDGGVDIDHKDLHGKIWVNTEEIADNGIDDDNNGYIDDIHGWSFLGNKDGENIEYENTEETRIIVKYKNKYKNVTSVKDLPSVEHESYLMYKSALDSYNEEYKKYKTMKDNVEAFEKYMHHCEDLVIKHLEKDTFEIDDIDKVETSDEELLKAKSFLKKRYKNGFTYEALNEIKEHTNKYVDKHLNQEFQPRTIIGDNPDDFSDTDYGNNDVKGPDPFHGTFVSGIIAGIRNNDYGVNGIAENVEIMVLRAVPNGDERDKDVALAIKYAVENGANIINMSFGKNYSPHKDFVDEAVKLAEKNNVLLVHASGNSGENLDKVERFPSNYFSNKSKVINWLNVGANAMYLDKKMPGVFSNYGQQNVDVFAPGVDVVSLFPNNKFQKSNGTSYSCPVVTGVAALVLSYYPDLSAFELKEILMESSSNFSKHKVYKPNVSSKKKKKTKFGKLSVSGGVVNVFKAFELAEKNKVNGLVLN
jgi:cell wall-associated protease